MFQHKHITIWSFLDYLPFDVLRAREDPIFSATFPRPCNNNDCQKKLKKKNHFLSFLRIWKVVALISELFSATKQCTLQMKKKKKAFIIELNQKKFIAQRHTCWRGFDLSKESAIERRGNLALWKKTARWLLGHICTDYAKPIVKEIYSSSVV